MLLRDGIIFAENDLSPSGFPSVLSTNRERSFADLTKEFLVVTEVSVHIRLLEVRVLVEQTLGKGVIFAFNSISLAFTLRDVSSRASILPNSLTSELKRASTTTNGHAASFVHSLSGLLSGSYTAPFAIGNLNKLVKENLIVFIDHRVPLLVIEIICALLFRPYCLLFFDDFLSLGRIDNSRRLRRYSYRAWSVSPLDHIKLLLMFTNMAIEN